MITITNNAVTDTHTAWYNSVDSESKTAEFADVAGQTNTYAFYAPELTLKSIPLDWAYNFQAWIISGQGEINSETVVAGDKVDITDHPSFFVRTRMDEELALVVVKTKVDAPTA